MVNGQSALQCLEVIKFKLGPGYLHTHTRTHARTRVRAHTHTHTHTLLLVPSLRLRGLDNILRILAHRQYNYASFDVEFDNWIRPRCF